MATQTSGCSTNQPSWLQVPDRPEIVNIKFSFAGSKPVPPEWPDKASRHFPRDKIHLSRELRPAGEAAPSTHTGFCPKSLDTTWAVESLVSSSNGGIQQLYSWLNVPGEKVSDLTANVNNEKLPNHNDLTRTWCVWGGGRVINAYA